jgi:hypothetical protein
MLYSSIGLPSKYGSWGLLDYSDQISKNPTHPKFQAVLNYNGRNGCNTYVYQFECVTNCPTNTFPRVVNNTLACVDCTSDCSASSVRFQITVRITLRTLSIVLMPSQPINPNFQPQFQIVLVPPTSRRLLTGSAQIIIPAQSIIVTASGISISAVIPNNVDTSVYSNMKIQFSGLTNSPTNNGALIADSNLIVNLAEIRATQGQSSKISILGQVVSLLVIVLLAVYVAY